MRTRVLLALTMACLGFAPAPPPRPKLVPDMTGLVGSWLMTRYQTGTTDSLRGRHMRVTIERDIWTFYIREQNQPAERASSKYVMKVDRDARPPRFTWQNNDSKAVQYVGTYMAGKDTLSILFTTASAGEGNRPTDFANPRGQDYLIELKRQATP